VVGCHGQLARRNQWPQLPRSQRAGCRLEPWWISERNRASAATAARAASTKAASPTTAAASSAPAEAAGTG
jgi:hypothetical protein